jgi:hypothetical protein
MRAEAPAEYGFHARFGKATASQTLQVSEPAVLFAAVETVHRSGVIVEKPLPDLRPDLERRASDSWSYPGQNAPRRPTHRAEGRFQDAPCQPTPACMSRTDAMTIIRREQHRQAIGGQDGANAPGMADDHAICNRLIRNVVLGKEHPVPVTLVQP